ncbi:MAG: response regulator transcription factor [Bacteroidetes bacterium]|nr:response regulator transcription factor [Bacteroidota bacterium]
MTKIKILIADDHAITRMGIKQVLSANTDFQFVCETSNGIETVNKVIELEPHLVFLDITMPHLNGIEACYQILKSKPLTKIIIITLNDPEDYFFLALEAGAHGFLRKDAPLEEFKLAVNSVLSGFKYLSPSISGKMINEYLQLKKNPVKLKKQSITGREKEVLTLIAEGYSSKEIAEKMNLSEKTIGTHRNNLMKKLGIHKTAELVRYALEKKIVVKGSHLKKPDN